MRSYSRIIISLAGALLFVPASYAASGELVLKTDFKIWEIHLNQMDWFSDYQKDYFLGLEVSPQEDEIAMLHPYLNSDTAEGVDSVKLRDYLQNKIAPEIDREKEDVTIDMDEDGNITFQGTGLYGRSLNLDKAVRMISYAISHDIEFVTLPLDRVEPVPRPDRTRQPSGSRRQWQSPAPLRLPAGECRVSVASSGCIDQKLIYIH